MIQFLLFTFMSYVLSLNFNLKISSLTGNSSLIDVDNPTYLYLASLADRFFMNLKIFLPYL